MTGPANCRCGHTSDRHPHEAGPESPRPCLLCPCPDYRPHITPRPLGVALRRLYAGEVPAEAPPPPIAQVPGQEALWATEAAYRPKHMRRRRRRRPAQVVLVALALVVAQLGGFAW